MDRARTPDDLAFTTADVVARLDEHGDLLADLSKKRAPLPDGG
jgi:hypothetical protein